MARGGEAIRKQTFDWARSLGLEVSSALPLIDVVEPVRSSEEAAGRLLCLHATAAVAYGCQPDLAIEWLEGLGLSRELSPTERDYVRAPERSLPYAIGCIEANWALCWALSVCDPLPLESATCPDDLVTKMPSMLGAGEGVAFISRATLRATSELLVHLDRAYYLHWLAADAMLNHRARVSAADPRIEWRRHSLEWLFDPLPWDDTPLDT